MIVRLNLSKPALTNSILLLNLLGLLLVGPTRAWADGINEFVMPTDGYVSFQSLGGEAGGALPLVSEPPRATFSLFSRVSPIPPAL